LKKNSNFALLTKKNSAMSEQTETVELELVAEGDKTIKNQDVSRIIRGLTMIGALEVDDFTVNYHIGRNITRLNSLEKSITKTAQAIIKKYVTKNEKGEPNVLPNNEYEFASNEIRNKYTSEMEKLNESPLPKDCKLWNLKLSDLKKVKGLKPTMWALCDEIIDDDLGIK